MSIKGCLSKRLAKASRIIIVSVIIVIVFQNSDSFGLMEWQENDKQISLEDALPLALNLAQEQFENIDNYLLVSVSPRSLKGDEKGVHWNFIWQERESPYYKFLNVKVYLNGRSLIASRGELGTYQKENYVLTKIGIPNGGLIDPEDVIVSMNEALEHALAKFNERIMNKEEYFLYSVIPHVATGIFQRV